MTKYISLEELDPEPPEGFKPFGFRSTKFDTSKKFNLEPRGDGPYAYFKIKGDKISVLRTNNYHKALNLNYRALDISPPKETHIGNMDTLEYTKYKLLRSLENFVHSLVRLLANNTKYLVRLSRKLRCWLRNYAFKAAFKGLRPFCKGKPKRPIELTYPFPTVRHIRTKVSTKSTSKKEFDPYDTSQFENLSTESSKSFQSEDSNSKSSSEDDT